MVSILPVQFMYYVRAGFGTLVHMWGILWSSLRLSLGRAMNIINVGLKLPIFTVGTHRPKVPRHSEPLIKITSPLCGGSYSERPPPRFADTKW